MIESVSHFHDIFNSHGYCHFLLQGKVCGLCGNFDDKSNNDFTSRSGLQETSALEFGNSWKQSSVCPDVTEEIKPCDLKPHRKSWAEKECSLILSEIFKICHSKVCRWQ